MDISDSLIEQFKNDMKSAKSYQDLMGENGAIKKLLKASLEAMLDAELTEHLGYNKYDSIGRNRLNSRNGKHSKTLKNDNGLIDIKVPRDRNGSFDPIIVKKYERTIGPIEDKIVSMYAKGMTVRDIQSHIHDLYGIDISPTLVSQITDKIVDLAKEWQNRPLDNIYPIVFLDAIFYKVQSNGRVIKKAAYTCLGIDISGHKDLLGLWVAETEGANFWLNVLTELKNRGVQQILVACVDGLKGFPEAINSVFPDARIQQCIIHLIRASLKYIASKDKKSFAKDLRNVYNAPTEEAALLAFDLLKQNWPKYSLAINVWERSWAFASTFFQFPDLIRKVIYTTNAVEGVHRQFRKVTKNKTIFPNDESLKKMLFLAYRDISKKWSMPIQNWNLILSNFSITFKHLIDPFL